MQTRRREGDTRGQNAEESILLRYFADIGEAQPLPR
jgi:hypothetical protein